MEQSTKSAWFERFEQLWGHANLTHAHTRQTFAFLFRAMESFAEMMGEDPLHMEGDAVDIGQLMKEHGIGMEISAVIDEKGHRIPADEFIAQKMREEETQQQAHGRSAGARDGAAGRKKGK